MDRAIEGIAATSDWATGIMPLAWMGILALSGHKLIFVNDRQFSGLDITHLAIFALHGSKVKSKRPWPYA